MAMEASGSAKRGPAGRAHSRGNGAPVRSNSNVNALTPTCITTASRWHTANGSPAIGHERSRSLEECRDDVRRGWEWQYLNGLFHPELLSFQEHRLPVRAVAFSPDGRLHGLCQSGQWGSNDPGEVIVWDVASGTENFRWKASTGPVTDLAFSSDGRLLAAGTGSWTQDDNTVKVWDVTSGRELRPLVSRVGRILSVAFCRRSPIDCRRRGPRRPTMGWDPSTPASRST